MKAPEVLDRVEAAIRKFRMFSHGDHVGVAVSGGRDSICLLDVLSRLAPIWDLRLSVLHVNHRLRPESDAEEAWVRGVAGRYGFDCVVDRPELSEGNLEESAREARLRFFQASGCDRVATGHTRSDQAETVLFRILRGTGSTGLAGIRPVAGIVVRPLLEVSRADVDRWVTENHLEFREDSSNSDPRFARNRIRRDLIPQLERDWNPQLRNVLAGMAATALAEDDFLAKQLPARMSEPDGAIVIAWAEIEGMHLALQRRLVRQTIARIKGDLNRIDFAHIEQVLSLRNGHDRTILPGVDVIRSFEWVRFSPYPRPADERRDWCMDVHPGIETETPGGDRISIELQRPPGRYNEIVSEIAPRKGPLALRNWRPGDRMRLGEQAAVSLKQLFQEYRIPLWERRNWPVLESAGRVVWAGEFGGTPETIDQRGVFVKLTRRELNYRPFVNQKSVFERL